MTAYLWHLTLNTGHGRRSYRNEVAADMVAYCGRLIREALQGAPATIGPGYELSAVKTGAALMATVQTIRGPIATVAVAPNAKVSAKLWDVLRSGPEGGDAKGDAPAAPWVAARIYPAAQADPALIWLGDFERTLAWAWIEGQAGDDGSSRSWEQDPRPLGECLKAWAASHDWSRDQAAAELRAPRSTYDKWCDGRTPASEATIRRMMDLIDGQSEKGPAPR